MAASHQKYSCKSASETLEWMNAIVDFLRPYEALIDELVVNFFKDSLWEIVDEEWMECVRKDSVDNLLGIPCGLVQVEILAAVVYAFACGAVAHTLSDVGSGQGYLAQALSFEYQLSVGAIDASLHYSTVTASWAESIKKHYENLYLKVLQVVTCHVLSSDMLAALSTSPRKDTTRQVDSLGSSISESEGSSSCQSSYKDSSLVLSGLHACGDLLSAERWGNLSKDADLQNFGLHAFHAAFQMVLDIYFPGVLTRSPSIGRRGKAFRCQQLKKSIESQFGDGGSYIPVSNSKDGHIIKVNSVTTNSSKSEYINGHYNDVEQIFLTDDKCTASLDFKFPCDVKCKEVQSFKESDECVLLKKFTEMGLNPLNLGQLQGTYGPLLGSSGLSWAAGRNLILA